MTNAKSKYIPSSPEELYKLITEVDHPFRMPTWHELTPHNKQRYTKLYNKLYEPERKLPRSGSLVKIELKTRSDVWHLGMTEDIVSENLGPQLVVRLFKPLNMYSGEQKEIFLPKDINSLVLFTDPYAKAETLW